MSTNNKKKKQVGLERLRAEYDRFNNELISLRSPCCSQAAPNSTPSDDDEATVWDSTDRLQLGQQEQVSKQTLVEQWNCSPRSATSTEPHKEAGECSTAPRLRITATTFFTANRGQLVVDECNSTAHADVNLGCSTVPRVTSPPSKSPREPTPRSESTGAVHLPVGEMVLASSCMNIHIGEDGGSSPERTLGYNKPTSPFQHRFIRPATARRLRMKIKDVLEKLDTGEDATAFVLGSRMVEAGASEAHAYLQNVVSALSSGSRGGTEFAPSDEHTFKDRENVSDRAPDSFREATDQPADQVKMPDKPADVSKETQCSMDADTCKDDKLVQCFILPGEPDRDTKNFLTKETQCSAEPVNDFLMREMERSSEPVNDFPMKATQVNDFPNVRNDPPHVPAIKLQKAYNWKSREKGKTKVDEAGDDDYAKKLLARRAQQNDEFLQRCRAKVGNLLQGFRLLEDAVKNPDRHQPPSLFQKGETSTSGKDAESLKRPALAAKEQRSYHTDVVTENMQPDSISTEGKRMSSRRAKPRFKPPVVKESRKKSAVKASEGDELDYDRMYEDLGDLIVERAQIEQLDRAQREHLSIPFCELGLGSYQEAVSEVKEMMGGKRSRMASSPAREPGNKLLRLNVGKGKPVLREARASSRFDRLLENMEEERKKLPRLDRLLAFKEERKEKEEKREKTTPRLDRLNAFKLGPEKEKAPKRIVKPVVEKKVLKKQEKLPAWVRRMTETKPKFGICEQLGKEDKDRTNLSGTVKRRNVRPPESIFKAGKHFNWLSTLPAEQMRRDKATSDPPQGRKPKKRGLFSEYGAAAKSSFAQREQHDRNTQYSDVPSADTFPMIRTNVSRKTTQSKVSKTFKGGKGLLRDGSKKKKQDWVVVGDFCISELKEQDATDELDRRYDAEEEAERTFPMDKLVWGGAEQEEEEEEEEQKEDEEDYGHFTEKAPKVQRVPEHFKPEVPSRPAKRVTKVDIKRKEYRYEQARPTSKGTSTSPDHLVIAGPSSGPSTNIICLHETDTCRKSLEEELFKQSLLEVLLKNLLEDEDQPADEPDVVRQTTCAHHDISTQRTTITPRRAPDQASTSYATVSDHRHYFAAAAVQSDRNVADRGAFQHVTSLTRPVKPAASDRPYEGQRHIPSKYQEDHAVTPPPTKPTLERCLAFKEELPEVEIRQQRSIGVQITGASHVREVHSERPSITVVPITFPIVFPVPVPPSQPQQRPPDVSVQTDAKPEPRCKEVQTMYESSSTSSPSTPSTPVSCPEREALVEAALKPISMEKLRPVSRPLIIITSPRQGTRDKSPFTVLGDDTSPSEDPSRTTRTGLELIQDLERRELSSPKSDRSSSLHVDEMESRRREQASEPAFKSSVDDEALVAGPYERGATQHESPSSRLVVEERHLLSRTKFTFEEEDMVTMSRETVETDHRRRTDIYELESPPSSPKETLTPITLPRKPKEQPATDKGKKHDDEGDTSSVKHKKFEQPPERPGSDRPGPSSRLPDRPKLRTKLAEAEEVEIPRTLKPFGAFSLYRTLGEDEPEFEFCSRQIPTPRLFPSTLNIYFKRTRNVPLLFGRQVLPSRELKLLAELERKAAVALRGKGFRSAGGEASLGRELPLSYQHFGSSPSTSHSHISVVSSLSESSETPSVSDGKISSSNSSEGGSDGSMSSRPEKLSEGEVDAGEINIGFYGDADDGDDGDETSEGEAPSLGEIG